jgi:hypothetical protein
MEEAEQDPGKRARDTSTALGENDVNSIMLGHIHILM